MIISILIINKMYVRDIRHEIICHLGDNVDELVKFCNIDKFSRQLCSTSEHWKGFFIKNNLIFPDNINYNKPIDWIALFKYYKLTDVYTQRILEILKNHETLIVSAKHINLFNLLKPHLSIRYLNTFLMYWIKHIMNVYKNNNDNVGYNYPTLSLFYIKKMNIK